MKKKLLLISPSQKERNKNNFSLAQAGTKMLTVPPLNLAMIAAHTPEDWEIKIIDERVEDIDFSQDADLVGITSFTASTPRAYYISKQFRSRGIPTVMGGIHASVLPDEAQQHVNSVVIGEAEGVWQRVILDFKHGELKSRYQHEQGTLPSLVALPTPRRDLFNVREYTTINTILNYRGCPHDCDFCSATRLFGNKYRQRPLDDVIDEVVKMRDVQQASTNNPIDKLLKLVLNEYKFMLILDDNVSGNRPYAKELFRRLIPLGITWAGQASRTIGYDDELLDLAAESGCQTLFIGFESISEGTLAEMSKAWGKRPDTILREHEDLIKRIHDREIGIEGAFILGYDGDSADVFERTVEFVERNHLELVQFTVPTPYPGTRLRDKLLSEERILLQYGWEHYDCATVVIKPPESTGEMTPEEFQMKYDWALDQVHSSGSIIRRVKQNRPLFYTMNVLYRWAIHEHRRMPFSQTA